MADFYTVFIDTTLDTHLAFIVSASDTVSDLKSMFSCFFTKYNVTIANPNHSIKRIIS
jgi:hypothetical protein